VNLKTTALMLGIVLATGCTANQQQGATRGATVGTVAGAAGAMMGALVFGGDVGDAALRGAVIGATSGAVAGTMSGSEKDRREAEAREKEYRKQLEALRKEIGDDAFEGSSQLVKCKHEIALAYGRTAAQSTNPDYAVAGLWLQALTHADQGDIAALDPVLATIVANDPGIGDMAAAEQELAAASGAIVDIRQRNGLPVACG